MPTYVNTFSAAVDDVMIRSGRPERKADIIAFLRSSIRECQVKRFFKRDMIEDILITDAKPYIWSYPQEFRIVRTVKYPILNLRNEALYPPEIMPGKKQRDHIYYYYGGPGYYAFAGLDSGSSIDIAYFSFLRKLPYYEIADRPALFSLEDNAWSYLNAVSDAEKLIAREASSNWILFDYYDTIIEGAMAKILKQVGDARSVASYALYKSYQNDLVAAEPSDSLTK